MVKLNGKIQQFKLMANPSDQIQRFKLMAKPSG